MAKDKKTIEGKSIEGKVPERIRGNTDNYKGAEIFFVNLTRFIGGYTWTGDSNLSTYSRSGLREKYHE